eukprot:1777665-Rhodomonas_salina.3
MPSSSMSVLANASLLAQVNAYSPTVSSYSISGTALRACYDTSGTGCYSMFSTALDAATRVLWDARYWPSA